MSHCFWRTGLVCALVLTTTACADEPPTALTRMGLNAAAKTNPDIDPAVVAVVRQLAASRGVGILERPPRVRTELVQLGQALIFDPILSGNKNISCMTCHLPGFGTGDGKALSVGEGGSNFGPSRSHPDGVFIPRNAPPLFNLGAMKRLFWDGRVQMEGQLETPAGTHVTADMRRVFEFGPISALGLFPVTNRAEMRGLPESGNELAAISDDDFTAIWTALMRRLGAIQEYRALFQAAYPGQRFDDMTFAHASNAIGGFIVEKLSFTNTPWDRFIRGDDYAMTPKQLEGAKMFMTLKCSICHGGPSFSDQEFHNVAVAQIGPGAGDGADGRDDFGRMRVTGNSEHRYRFRSTPLRNVELTGPYGHDGAIASLRDFIEHYSESHLKLLNFDASVLEPALRGTLVPNASQILAQRDTLLEGVVFGSDILDMLMDYMSALTDDAARDLSKLTPTRVPSRIKVEPARKP